VRLLVVEDDPGMASLLRRALARQGYAVEVAGTGEDALWHAQESEFDALVLDAMIPAPDGFEVCRRLRQTGHWLPVLMLTARAGVDDRVLGLDAGADDYLVKPFELAELYARLRALTRRELGPRPVALVVGDLVVDPVAHTVHRAGRRIELSPREFALAHELARHAGAVLSRTQLLERVWDAHHAGDSNVVDVYVGYLRAKLDRPFGRSDLQTVRGVGYRLGAAASPA